MGVSSRSFDELPYAVDCLRTQATLYNVIVYMSLPHSFSDINIMPLLSQTICVFMRLDSVNEWPLVACAVLASTTKFLPVFRPPQ